MPRDARAAVVGLGEEHPAPLDEAGVADGFRDDVGQPAYGGELLVRARMVVGGVRLLAENGPPGAVAMARAEQSLEPFELVARQVVALART